jgi:hypothetical protein
MASRNLPKVISQTCSLPSVEYMPSNKKNFDYTSRKGQTCSFLRVPSTQSCRIILIKRILFKGFKGLKCQMAYFQTKNTNLGLAMKDIGLFYGHLVYFWPFGIFYGYLVHFMITWCFFPFWYVVPRKIWQPCSNRKETASKIL